MGTPHKQAQDTYNNIRSRSYSFGGQRRIIQASTISPGIAASVETMKNETQSIRSASQPAPDDMAVRENAISEVNSAYWVAV